jgi:hypothetical protein
MKRVEMCGSCSMHVGDAYDILVGELEGRNQ